MNKIKNINKYFFVWGIVCLSYIVFIGVLTWLYPFGGDELFEPDLSLFQHVKNFSTNPIMAIRIGCFISMFFVHMGKIFYDIVNPFLQLSIIFSAFYFIYMRFPRLNCLQDLLSFLLLLSLGTFFIAQPAETILWIGGATNYAWVFLAFIWFLVYLRKLEEGKVFTGKILPLLFFVWGIFLGLMNENNSPMVLCLMAAFTVYAHLRKIVLRKDFWFLMLGAALGTFILFKFSGNDIRLQIISFGFPMHHTLGEKLFMHLPHMNSFAEANLWLIYLLPLFLLLLFLDKRKEIIRDKNFCLSCICWLVAFGLSIVLCEAPRVATRAFYSASWFCIFSFFFILLQIEKVYKIQIIKYFSVIFIIIFLYFAPLFFISVKVLSNGVHYRQNLINNAKINGRKEIYLSFIPSVKLLTNNLVVPYYDSLVINNRWSTIEGIEIKNEMGDNVRYM